MERAVVFAHYDKDCIIDDYVIYYLKKLKEICKTIVFVSCIELSNEEKSKLNGIADFVIDESHNEYDFGSYKRGYMCLKENGILNIIDELTFANDSCYGPFFDLSEIFVQMENKNCDFWGMTLNRFGFRRLCNRIWQCKRPHIQSYFIVFNSKVFLSDEFQDFIISIKQESDKKDIIMNYEIGLSEKLINSGFKCLPYVKKYLYINNSAILRWRELIEECRMPLMKCSLARLVNWKMAVVEGYQEVINNVSDYPVELIERHAERTKERNYRCGRVPVKVKRNIMRVVSILPFPVRKACTIVIYRYLPYLLD